MKIVTWLMGCRILSRLTRLTTIIEQQLGEANEVRQELDRRIDNVTKATLNGEEEWFLQLVKKDPDCAFNIIKDCDLGRKNSK